jgi:hypothetical protein
MECGVFVNTRSTPPNAGQRRAELPRLSFQGALHPLRIASDDFEIGSGRLIRLGAPLLPVAQRAERNMITRGKRFLSEAERTPQ